MRTRQHGSVRFRDRVSAGRELAAALAHLRGQDPVVLGLPRGGIPVAAEVVAVVGGALDVLVVRKLGVPWQPELALGAVGEGGITVINEQLLATLGLSDDELAMVIDRERDEVARRVALYRGTRPCHELRGRVVVIVDDGIATGATARAAVAVVRAHGPRRVIVASPVASSEAEALLAEEADELVVLASLVGGAVGASYADFTQTGDGEVVAALAVSHLGH